MRRVARQRQGRFNSATPVSLALPLAPSAKLGPIARWSASEQRQFRCTLMLHQLPGEPHPRTGPAGTPRWGHPGGGRSAAPAFGGAGLAAQGSVADVAATGRHSLAHTACTRTHTHKHTHTHTNNTHRTRLLSRLTSMPLLSCDSCEDPGKAGWVDVRVAWDSTQGQGARNANDKREKGPANEGVATPFG